MATKKSGCVGCRPIDATTHVHLLDLSSRPTNNTIQTKKHLKILGQHLLGVVLRVGRVAHLSLRTVSRLSVPPRDSLSVVTPRSPPPFPCINARILPTPYRIAPSPPLSLPSPPESHASPLPFPRFLPECFCLSRRPRLIPLFSRVSPPPPPPACHLLSRCLSYALRHRTSARALLCPSSCPPPSLPSRLSPSASLSFRPPFV